ncbi:MAG: polyphenol oxidase family protein [Longimicrobiaceae bacterium]
MSRTGTVFEELAGGSGVPLWVHPEWAERFPGVVQGTTGRGGEEAPFDLGLWGAQPAGEALGNWRRLLEHTGAAGALHSRQQHGVRLRINKPPSLDGLLVVEGYDGHLTGVAGVLLTVSVADCVPVFLAGDQPGAVGVLHVGWRGVAGGMVEVGIRRMRGPVRLHCGPAICGRCYEVGPEVHRAVHPDRPAPAGPLPIDLRAAIHQRALRAGVPAGRLTLSGHCTLCGPGGFFSHRRGDRERQLGVIGLRAPA